MTDYYYKYIKYKNKYLTLIKNNKLNNSSHESIMDFNSELDTEIDRNLVGGGKNIIIHISGPSGAGKTTLGNKLKYEFGNKIIVADIDDLRFDFVKKEYGGFSKFKFTKSDNWNSVKYQKYIDAFIKKNNAKPIIFVGLNHMPWWNKSLYYDMHPDYKFYIKLNSDIIFKQKCSRFIEQVFIQNKNQMLNDIIKDEKSTIKNISNGYKNDCSYDLVKKMNKIWNIYYKSSGYKFFTREVIFDKVCGILDSIFDDNL